MGGHGLRFAPCLCLQVCLQYIDKLWRVQRFVLYSYPFFIYHNYVRNFYTNLYFCIFLFESSCFRSICKVYDWWACIYGLHASRLRLSFEVTFLVMLVSFVFTETIN